MTGKFAIKLLEYERMFQVINSISEKLDDRDGASCLFYNTIGAFLIESVLKIKARPVIGAAFILVDNATDTVLCFSNIMSNNVAFSDKENFHCWVETQDHIIDFTAPVYQKYFDRMNNPLSVPRRMFQKRKCDMSPSYQTFSKEGDFFVQENIELTKSLLSKQPPSVGDLADICCRWYKSPPKKIDKSMVIENDLGEIIAIDLTSIRISGGW